MSNRRHFISLLGGAALAWPLSARAQQPGKIPRIGIIDDSPIWNAFRNGLRDLGYLESHNIAFEYRYAGGLPERLAWVAAELVRRPVDLIATFGTPPTHAAKEATRTIPIVMIGIGDPVGAGLVSSLARPGGNITGNTILGPEVSGKRVELIKELIPSVARVAFLWNPNNTSHPAQLAELHSVVRTFGMQLIPVAARSQEELDSALAAAISERADAFLMTADPLHQISIMKILDFLSSNRLPGMFTSKEIVAVGGLISYGASVPDLFRRGALYAHKILQGAKPADLPVEQPTKFELAFNLNTAKALGLTIPPRVLAIADEVIE
jgi:putative tryptophan/tyrosine transport system substrate-binding protein